jgi:hypothetical protein
MQADDPGVAAEGQDDAAALSSDDHGLLMLRTWSWGTVRGSNEIAPTKPFKQSRQKAERTVQILDGLQAFIDPRTEH